MQEISFIPFRDLMPWIVWNANIFVEKIIITLSISMVMYMILKVWLSILKYIQDCTEKHSKTVEFLLTWIMMLKLGLTF